MHALLDAAQSLLDLLFPPRRVACGAGGAILCRACRESIRAPQRPLCTHCGQSLAQLPVPQYPVICPGCAAGHGPKALTAIYAASVYEGAVRQAILALKDAGRRRLADPLGDLLAVQVRRADTRPDLIVPVPLHAGRLRERGYNQAELLARRCAARVRISCRTELLLRMRPTPSQVGPSLAERRANVRNAFALASGVARSLAGKRILLIDDVATTGSTLDAASAALLPAMPAAVVGLAVSRPDPVDAGTDADGTPDVTAQRSPAKRPYARDTWGGA